MHQADDADTIGDAATSGGNSKNVSARPSRRALIGGAAFAIGCLAAPAIARAEWNARDWLRRWHAIGWGARTTAAWHPELTPRLGGKAQNARCAAMLAELGGAGRIEQVAALLRRHAAIMEELA